MIVQFYGVGKTAAAIIAVAEATADSLAWRHRRVGGWGDEVVQVWCQPGAGILQCLCDSCKILVAIMEQSNAVKAHDVRTSASNIVRALRDSFTINVLQSCNVCTIE